MITMMAMYLRRCRRHPALQQAGGGTWGGCVYDVDAIVAALGRGMAMGK
jgi:hypothetical protein